MRSLKTFIVRLSSRPFVWSAMLAACACLLAPRAGSSQAVPYMTALSIPPSTVGTCMPDERAVTAAQPRRLHMRESHLLMKTRSPGGDRDIDVIVDYAGVVRGYSELVIRQTGLTSNESDAVTAGLTTKSVIEGVIIHRSLTMPQPDLRSGIPLDSAMRAANAHATHTSTRASLSAADVARVRAISDWLVKRCPPR